MSSKEEIIEIFEDKN